MGNTFEPWKPTSPIEVWRPTDLQGKSLQEVFSDTAEEKEIPKKADPSEPPNITEASESFRDKSSGKYRTKDGHLVQSRGEAMIDNALYHFGVVHIYEGKLPIGENVLYDFYLHAGDVYIEYWGMENDLQYAKRQKKKMEIYKKYNCTSSY